MRALDHIAAISLCNEGTLRDWVRHAKFNVTQGKNFDSAGSLGPWLVPYTDQAADRGHPADHARQWRDPAGRPHRAADFWFSLSAALHLDLHPRWCPGDVIVTGTPTGAGARFDPPRYLKPGDVVEVESRRHRHFAQWRGRRNLMNDRKVI